jgi:hypothetical protein
MPSLAPSVIEQTITVPGQLTFSQDICALDADAQATFVATTLQTIQQVSNCYPVDGCEPQLLMFVEFVGVVSDGCNRVGLGSLDMS